MTQQMPVEYRLEKQDYELELNLNGQELKIELHKKYKGMRVRRYIRLLKSGSQMFANHCGGIENIKDVLSKSENIRVYELSHKIKIQTWIKDISGTDRLLAVIVPQVQLNDITSLAEQLDQLKQLIRYSQLGRTKKMQDSELNTSSQIMDLQLQSQNGKVQIQILIQNMKQQTDKKTRIMQSQMNKSIDDLNRIIQNKAKELQTKMREANQEWKKKTEKIQLSIQNMKYEHNNIQTETNESMIMELKEKNNPIDINSAYISKFQINEGLIKYQGQNQKRTVLFGKKTVRQVNSITITIVKMLSNNTAIGIADATLIGERQPKKNNIQLYGFMSQLVKNGSLVRKKQGIHAFKQGNIAQLKIEGNKVTWIVEGVIIEEEIVDKLSDPSINWVPYILMRDTGAQLKWENK